MPINWQDGVSGGTPLSAANLNRLAVVADIGTPGTPTGDALKAALVPRPSGGTDGQALVKSGANIVWGTIAGGAPATTSASALTSGTLDPARIADGTLSASKLDFSANGAFTRTVVNGTSTTTPRPAGAGMVIWIGSVASVNMADGDIRISTS